MLGKVLGVDGVRRCHIYGNVRVPRMPTGYPVIRWLCWSMVVRMLMSARRFSSKNPGVTLHQAGTRLVAGQDLTRTPQLIKFGRPKYVDMIVAMQITNDGSLPSDIETQITEAIIDYAAGDFIADEYGVSVKGFDIGEDVPFSRLYAPIMQVLGAYGNSYVQTLTLNGSTSNIGDCVRCAVTLDGCKYCDSGGVIWR